MFFLRAAAPAKIIEFLILISLSFCFSSNIVNESLCESPCLVKGNDFRHRIYVLFLGLSGSGKSTTINLLFNASITEVGGFESTTSEIHEYSLSISNSKYNDTELRLIDTPGLEDTNGLEHDARFLATLEEYLKNHQELRYRPPDVVLICSRFDDNRFYGHSAKFVKMLRAISSLRNLFVNPNYSNLIFVMTHYMGVSEAEAQNPEAKKLDVQNAIKDFSLLPDPIRIVLAENKGEDQELEKVDLGYKLPNGEIYPENLYKAVEEVLMLSDSGEVKSGLVSTLCTRDNSSLNVRAISQTPLVQKEDVRAKKWLEQLTAANLKTEDTEISLRLSNVFEDLPGEDKLPPDTLQYFQKALHLRNIIKMDDVPRSDFEISSLFRQLDRMSDAELLFKAAFGIEGSHFPFLPSVGNGYDVSEDSVVESSSPFDLTESEKCPRLFSQLGYINPPCVTTTLDSQTKFYYHKFGSDDDYERHRADSLGISKSLMSNSVSSLKPGRNFVSGGSCPSLLIEFRTLKMELSEEVELNRKYLSQLEQLPAFDVSIPSSIQKWSRFLQFYGTHVITSAYGGGSIQINWDNYNCSSPSLVDLFESILWNKFNSTILQSMENQVTLKIKGGDREYHAQSPALFFLERDRTSLFNLWKNSLENKPITLYNDIKIKPISEYVRIANKISISEILDKAARFFLEDQKDEHPLVAKVKEFTNEKINLEKSVQQVGEEKAELEKSLKKLNEEKAELQNEMLRMAQELMTTKTSLNEALIKLEVEKGTVASLTSEIQSLKTDKNNLQDALRRVGEESNAASTSFQQKIDEWRAKDAATQPLREMELISRPAVGCTPCGEIMKGISGSISYKRYSTYDNNERCAWIVRVPQSYSKIKFIKSETDFELNRDYITLRIFKNNGDTGTWHHLGKTANSRQEVIMEGNVAVVFFHTDGSVTKKGFFLSFEAQGPSSDNSRAVSYHNDYISGCSMGNFKYPISGTYHNNELSIFVISKLYRKNTFTLSIRNGRLENSTNCQYDRLIVYKMNDDFLFSGYTYCGNFDSGWSGDNFFIVVLATDSSATYNGFELSWT